MSVRNERCLLSLLSLGVLAGCSSDLALPVDSQIDCQGGKACPAGYVCNLAGRCEKTSAMDRVPPSLVGTATVDPAVGKQGAKFTVRFTASEVLSQVPEVTVDLATRQAPLEPVASSEWAGGGENRFEYTYTATGGEPEGSRKLTIQLVDKSGNTAPDTSATLVFDFTAPRVVSPTFDPAHLQVLEGAPGILLHFEVSESLPADHPPVVLFQGGRSWTSEAPASGSGFSFRYVAARGTDQEETSTPVVVQLRDVAGNEAEQTLDSVVFDFTPSGLASQSVTPAAATVGSTVTVSVTANEKLTDEPTQAPALTVANGPATLDFGTASQEGQTYLWSRKIEEGDAAGTYTLAVTMSDVAGNRGEVQLSQSLDIDRSAPTILAPTVSVSGGQEPWPRLLKGGDTLTVAFAVSEPLEDPPLVTLGSRRLDPPGQVTEGDQPSYAWTLPIPAEQPTDTVAEGVQGLTVELVDLAGNRTTDADSLGQVTFDFTAPAVTFEQTSPVPAAASTLVTTTVTFNERLGEAPFLTVDPPLPMPDSPDDQATLVTIDDPAATTSFSFDYATPQEGADSSHRLTVHAVDLAGNTVVLPLQDEDAIVLDLSLPVVSNVEVTTPTDGDRANLADCRSQRSVLVAFDVAEGLPALPTVRIGPHQALCDAGVVRDYVCAYHLSGCVGENPGAWPESDGPKPISISTVDRAGNRAENNENTVTFDFTPPALTFEETSPATAAASTLVTTSVTFNERLREAPTLAVDPPLPADPADLPVLTTADDPAATTSFSFTYTTPRVGSDGSHALAVHATDLAGNPADIPLRADNAIVLDLSPSRISGIHVTTPTAGGYANLADCRAQRTVTVAFDLDAGVAAMPTVRIGPYGASCSRSGDQSFVCVYRLSGCPGQGPWSESDGDKLVSISVVDDAGNPAGDSSQVVRFDFTPPGLTFEDTSPATAAAATLVTTSVTFTERLREAPTLAVAPPLPAEPADLAVLTTMDDPATTTSFSFTYTTPLAGSDGSHAATVHATDLAGNPADIPLRVDNAIVLDLTPPRISGIHVTTPTAGVYVNLADCRAQQSVTVAFDLDEDVAAMPTVRIGPHGAGCSRSGDQSFTCAYRLSGCPGQEPWGESDGDKLVSISVVDDAGNPAGDTSQVVRFDFTPPGLTFEETSPATAATATLVTTSVTFNERLQEAPILAVDPPLPADPVDLPVLTTEDNPAATTSFSFTYTTPPDGSDGPHALTAHAVDLAGNAADIPLRADNAIVLDLTPPRISGLHVTTPTAGGYVNLADCRTQKNVTVAFDLDAGVAAMPTVRIGPHGASCSRSDDRSFACTYRLSGCAGQGPWSESDGDKLVSISVVDDAGNPAGDTSQVVRFDFTPPSLTFEETSPATVAASTLVTTSVTFNERLREAPTLAVAPPLPADPADLAVLTTEDDPATTTSFSFAYTAPPVGSDGSHVLTVHATDLAGNAADVPLRADDAIVLDLTRPTISDVEVTTPTVDGWVNLADCCARRSVVVAFDVDEALAAPPAVRIGPHVAACGPGAVRDYECAYRLGGCAGDAPEQWPERDGAKPIGIMVTDLAGNVSENDEESVWFDFAPPAVVSASVGYVPGADNPLGVPARGKVGTLLVINASAGEVLGDTLRPELTLDCEGTVIAAGLPATGVVASAVTFQVTVPPGTGDATCTPAIRWRDVAGNETATASFAVPPVLVKTSTPALSVDQDAVTFVRSPWGNAAAEDLGSFTIPAGPYFALAPADPLANVPSLPARTFAMTGGTLARVRIWADAGKASLLGVAAASGDGSWPRLRLANLDAPTAYATGVDDAGNESAAVRIQNGEWVATPDPPAFGTSPHALQTLGLAQASRTPDPQTSAAAPAGAEQPDGASVLASTEAVWRKWIPAVTGPSARFWTSMAWDSIRGRAVVFGGGGDSGSAVFQDTWEWDGNAWQDVTPGGTKPSVRGAAAMAFDAARGRTVLFGGYYARGGGWYGLSAETWEWDGSAWSLRQPAAAPSGRFGHALAWDAARARVVLFGGYDWSAGNRNDTWEWDGTTWTQRTPASAPPVRSGHAMAWDSGRGRLVLFGGCSHANCPPTGVDPPTTFFDDTWEWDGNAWFGPFRPSPRPAARGAHTMTYDAARGRIVLVGGNTAAGSQKDVWEWDGSAWTQRASTSAAPAPRYLAASAWDAQRSRTILFAGWAAGVGSSSDIWEWDGSAWAQRTPGTTQPPNRYRHAMSFDSTRGRTVVCSGTDNLGHFWNDTWEWDGSAWQNRTPAGAVPGYVASAMVFDSNRGVSVLFGGSGCGTVSEIWEWSGSSWNGPILPATRPPPRAYHAMAFDSARGRTIVHGGDAMQGGVPLYDDVWEWDGTRWYGPFQPANRPSARSTHALAYDSARHRTVLFGGGDDQTWEWDGSTWYGPLLPAVRPPARGDNALAFDPVRQRVVLVDGSTPDRLQDVWEWDGTSWTDRTPTRANPTARASMGFVWDTVRGLGVLFGGGDATNLGIGDTWELEADPSHQAAVQFTVGAATGGFGLSNISGLRVRAHAGGTSGTGPGAVLYGWASGGTPRFGGTWATLGTSSAGLNASQPYLPAPPDTRIDWTAPSASEAQRYLTDRDRVMAFQCRPAGAAGSGTTTVALDYIEARVRYSSTTSP